MCTDPNSCSHICAVIGETEICFCPIGLEISSQNSSACVGGLIVSMYGCYSEKLT